ncbi:hypothetical protein LY78DRAFT_341723 [Colletotrichum sublineola]|nr:hypothetical protein LY78DRAFT_341723 [Colletotrichum sublineola]
MLSYSSFFCVQERQRPRRQSCTSMISLLLCQRPLAVFFTLSIIAEVTDGVSAKGQADRRGLPSFDKPSLGRMSRGDGADNVLIKAQPPLQLGAMCRAPSARTVLGPNPKGRSRDTIGELKCPNIGKQNCVRGLASRSIQRWPSPISRSEKRRWAIKIFQAP